MKCITIMWCEQSDKPAIYFIYCLSLDYEGKSPINWLKDNHLAKSFASCYLSLLNIKTSAMVLWIMTHSDEITYWRQSSQAALPDLNPIYVFVHGHWQWSYCEPGYISTNLMARKSKSTGGPQTFFATIIYSNKDYLSLIRPDQSNYKHE
jgi:hypothetical protein